MLNRRIARLLPVLAVALTSGFAVEAFAGSATVPVPSPESLIDHGSPEIAAQRHTNPRFRYQLKVEVRVEGRRGRHVRRMLTKKRQVTLGRLKPGTYQARYRTVVVRPSGPRPISPWTPARRFEVRR